MIPVNQVSVNMDFTLTAQQRTADLRRASHQRVVRRRRCSRMALTLVNERADEVVAKLVLGLLSQRRAAAAARYEPRRTYTTRIRCGQLKET